MQFKAEVIDREGHRLVRLAGWLQRQHLAELLSACEASPPPLRIDLTDLLSVDASGLDALLSMRRRGVELEGASPYLTLQMERVQAGRVQT